ncbi:hypothetical protein Lal_00019925 [Lupinus albus]|nr:hypothetical protein Lal_00019925 [Lupinus albus]
MTIHSFKSNVDEELSLDFRCFHFKCLICRWNKENLGWIFRFSNPMFFLSRFSSCDSDSKVD